MLAFFRAAACLDPGPRWKRGQRFCLAWMALLRRPRESVTQADVDELLSQLDGEPDPGPAWPVVRQDFVRWASCRGFLVPTIVLAEPHATPDPPS